MQLTNFHSSQFRSISSEHLRLFSQQSTSPQRLSLWIQGYYRRHVHSKSPTSLSAWSVLAPFFSRPSTRFVSTKSSLADSDRYSRYQRQIRPNRNPNSRKRRPPPRLRARISCPRSPLHQQRFLVSPSQRNGRRQTLHDRYCVETDAAREEGEYPKTDVGDYATNRECLAAC